MRSIMQTRKECYVCYDTSNLEIHHSLYGTANRKLAEKDGLKVWLCAEHHRGDYGVHGKYGHTIDSLLKSEAQQIWMGHYNKTKEDFISRYGRNYL